MRNARLITGFLAVALVSGAKLWAQSDATPESGSALESARKDLQTLPSTNDGVGSSKDPALKFSMPSAPSANGGGERRPQFAPNFETSPDKNSSSPNWLLDAWRKGDEKAQVRKNAETQRNVNGADRELTKSKNDAANPFTPYLQQWISPRDQNLLQLKGPNDLYGASSSAQNFNSFGKTDSSQNAAGRNEGAQGPQNSSAKTETTLVNPYLPSSDVSAAPGTVDLSANRFLSSTQSPKQAELPRASTNGAVPSSSSQKSARTPARRAEPAFVPPTAPIIDERKYFPQLHRF